MIDDENFHCLIDSLETFVLKTSKERAHLVKISNVDKCQELKTCIFLHENHEIQDLSFDINWRKV